MANTYKNKVIDLTSTSKTTVYTCPSNTTALIKTIQLTNETGSVNVEVFIEDVSATSEVEISHSTMSARSTENFAKGTIILEAGDILKIKAASANTVTGILGILQIDF